MTPTVHVLLYGRVLCGSIHGLPAGLVQCVLLAFLLVLYFGASPGAAARVAMYFAGGQILAHGFVWWVFERER